MNFCVYSPDIPPRGLSTSLNVHPALSNVTPSRCRLVSKALLTGLLLGKNGLLLHDSNASPAIVSNFGFSMRTTTHEMNIFVRAVETNSFVGAARSLLIDPAAVSRAVKALETDLGVLLFARSTRAMKLTAEGMHFYRDCVSILKKLEQATQQFRTDRARPHGRLKIGMAPGLSRRMLLRAIPAFQEQYPEIEMVLLNVDDITEVGDKGIDILVRGRSLRRRGGQHPESQGVVVRKLAQSRLVICASPSYIDRAGTPRAPADLLQHVCVAQVTLERDIQDEWHFVKAHMRQKVKIVPRLLVQGTDAVREAVVSGSGIVRIAACHIEDELHMRKLVPILTDWECPGPGPIVAIYRKTRPMPPQLNVFVRYLTQAFQRYNWSSKATPPAVGRRLFQDQREPLT